MEEITTIAKPALNGFLQAAIMAVPTFERITSDGSFVGDACRLLMMSFTVVIVVLGLVDGASDTPPDSVCPHFFCD